MVEFRGSINAYTHQGNIQVMGLLELLKIEKSITCKNLAACRSKVRKRLCRQVHLAFELSED